MEKADYTRTYRLLKPLADINIRGVRRITKIISSLLIPKGNKNGVVIKTLHGFYLCVDPLKDRGVERDLYYLGDYETGTLTIMDHILRPGNIVVDIGANIGLMTIFASVRIGKNGKVYAFEANPETKKILDSNIKLNDVSNVITSPYALGAESGQGKIYTNWHINRGGASLLKSNLSSDYFPVEIIRLDQFSGMNDLKTDLIKIDIEGYELEALKGCGAILNSPQAPMLIIECSNAGKNYQPEKGDIFQFLTSRNKYRFFVLTRGSERKSPLKEITHPRQVPHHSNIFCFLNDHLTLLPANIII